MPKKLVARDLSDSELTEELARARQEVFDLRFKLATGQLENHASMSKWRRQIARIETELREREIAAAELAASTGGAS